MVDHLPGMNSGFKLQNQKKETVKEEELEEYWGMEVEWREGGAGGRRSKGQKKTESPQTGSCYGWSPPRCMQNMVALGGGASQVSRARVHGCK